MNASERFERFVAPEPNSGCWLWTGGCNEDGYGAFYRDGRQYRAHRVAYEMEFGTIPPGAIIRHKCDQPCCVNPTHLECGSPADNSADMVRRNRQAKGERQGLARLTEDLVREIRRSPLTNWALHKQSGIPEGTIYCARRRLTWKHV